MKFKCHCNMHIVDINKRSLKGEDYISLTIYNHRSMETGKYFKKLKEEGTVVLIGSEARKFKKWLNNKEK